MKRWFGLLGSMVVTGAFFLGCGNTGTEPLRTAPGTDTRSPQEKETDDLMQKSLKEYNKRAR
jgi:hypothetical protein